MEQANRWDRAWVTGQFIVMTGTVIASIFEAKRRPPEPTVHARLPRRAMSAALMASAGLIASSAARELGDSLKMAPSPVSEGHLVDTGVFGIVRHPLYLAALLVAAAWALLMRTRASLIGLVVAAAFFHGKAIYEESLLQQRYPGYAAYREQVPARIIPLGRGLLR